MGKHVFNPYLPSWEYVPDGEPHVFGDRVYVYGSHDHANGPTFCRGDYICWSAPIDDLKNWKYEGIIYRKDQDPCQNGRMVLYAPDVTRGPDGKYYLYYVFDKVNFMSVAVCDTPAGKYEFYGYVHYKDGTRLGERKGDMPQFDPGVITEGDITYLYSGFAGHHMKERIGAFCVILGKDMLTIEQEPKIFIPGDQFALSEKEVIENLEEVNKEVGCPYEVVSIKNWEGFKGHGFFEASSIRKIGDVYYFIYSSELQHELCYATSKHPIEGFVYRGCIVSNADIGISSYKPADMPTAYGANNHGGIEKIKDNWYIFYHRHTNGTWFSRQSCAEKIEIKEDGSIPQVEMTSCGLNGGPLPGKGEYPVYIACNIFTDVPSTYVADGYPKITQDGRDLDDGTPEDGIEKAKDTSYITGLQKNTTIGFKYFDFKGVKKITITTRAYMKGDFEIRTQWDGPVLGRITIQDFSNYWEENSCDIEIPDGVSALYLKFVGDIHIMIGQIKSIKFE